jgi:GNAT superfamily N-acetyltransferase
MIREATHDDVVHLVRLSEMMHAESPRYSRLTFSPEKMAAMLHNLIDSPNGFVRVLELDGRIAGLMVAMVAEHWMSTDMVAVDFGVYVTHGVRGVGAGAVEMVARYRQWAKERGAVWPQIGVSAGVCDEAAERMYERAGARRVGSIWEL